MSTVSVGEELKRYYKKATKPIYSRVSNKSTALSQEGCENESDDIFTEAVDSDEDEWVGVSACGDFPKEDHVESYRLQHGTGPIQDLTGKLREKAVETAVQTVVSSTPYAIAGMGYIADSLGYFEEHHSIEHYARAIYASYPTLSLKAAFGQSRDKAFNQYQQQNKVDQLAASYSRPPDQRVRDPRDAPAGSNLDGIALFCNDRPLNNTTTRYSVNANLTQPPPIKSRLIDQFDGKLEDIPLDDDGDDKKEDEDWEQLQ